MKIRYFVRIALVFLVALSLVLTWAIWTMPNKIENSSDSNSKKTGINSTLQENEIFSANRVVFHTDNNPKLASNPDLMARLDKEFYEWKFSNIKDAKTYNDEDYTSKLGEGNSLEFIYPTARPFSTLTKSFSKLASNYRNQTFQRIVIPLNESGEIHFFDDNSRTVYSAEIEGFNKSTLSDVLTSNEKYFVDVSIQKLATRFVYLPKEEVELSSPSYIAELKPSLEIRNRLFEDLSEITNSTTADKRFEQYYDNVSKVTVDKETNILTYNRSSTSVKLDLQDVLKYSISELKDFEVWPGKIRFFQYNNTKQQVVYRRYIEGFPVFGRGGMENDFGGTYLTIAKDGVLSRMQMSLVIAQTPVFDEMAEKRLLNGSELIAHLDSIGYPINTIDNIELGYCWTKNLESDGLESEESGANTIVDFEPSWYIFTNGIWYNIDELSDNQDGRQSEMDFKRIELIFLLTFLSLNIFLLYSYFGKATTLTYESAETSTVVPFDEMKKDGIKFDAKQFSDEKLLVPYVKAKNDNLLKQKVDQLPKDTTISMEDKHTIYRPLTEPLELFPVGEKFNSKDIKKYAEKIDAFIAKEHIFFGESYNFFKYSATQNAIIYTQKAEGFRILDGTGRITFHMDGGKIISYIQTYAGKIEVTGKSRPLISEKNAIESLYQNNEIPADSVINGRPKLGYYRTLWLPKDNLSIYGPVWYVSLKIGNEEKIKLVSGVDGTIIKHTSSTTNDSDSSSDGAATEEELAPLE